jgi:hypothetical protein
MKGKMNDKIVAEINAERVQLNEQRKTIDERLKVLDKAKETLSGKKTNARKNSMSPRGENLRRISEALQKRHRATARQLAEDSGVNIDIVRQQIIGMKSGEKPVAKEVATLEDRSKLYEWVGEAFETVEQQPAQTPETTQTPAEAPKQVEAAA